MQTELISLSSIIIKDRVRGVDDEIEDLCASLVRFGGEPRGMLQPPIIDQNNVLQDGFRRYTAATKLGWTTIPVHRRDALSEAEYFEVELETNFRRRGFTWQENIAAVVKVHKTRQRQGILAGAPWTMAMTGELLGGYSDSYVSNCLALAPLIASEDFATCDNITDAVRVMYRRKLDASMAELTKRTALVPQLTPTSRKPVELAINVAVGSIIFTDEPCPGCAGKGEINGAQCGVCRGLKKAKKYDENGNVMRVQAPLVQELVIDLSSTLFLGDSVRVVLPAWPSECVDHIICDPPYGVDVAMMEQATTGLMDASRIAETHDVEENLNLFSLMFQQFYRVMKNDRFLVLFADEMQRQVLFDHATAAGFRVQRWSHIWVKTSQCKNQMAHVNETKATEIALICRKGNATLPSPVANNYTICANDAERASNPFAKPFDLWSDLINRFTILGQTILDPFAGEGSSTVAALRLNRPVLAIEKDEKHFNYLVENVKTHWRSVQNDVKFV